MQQKLWIVDGLLLISVTALVVVLARQLRTPRRRSVDRPESRSVGEKSLA